MPRPKIKLPYSLPEKLLQIFTAASLLGFIALTVFSMIRLPQTIPTHFGADGRPNAWGGKGSLLPLPVMAAAFYAAITVLERFPWVYNYPVWITEENAAQQYKIARQLLEWLKFVLVAIFFYLQWQTTRVAMGLSGGLGSWFLPVFVLLMFGGIGLSVYRMVRQK